MARGQSAGDFGITKFMSKVDALGGIARKNRFSVQITPPTTLVSDVNAATINFLASAVAFPARAFGTTTYRSGGRFGLDVPYETTYEAVTLTMLNTNNHAPRKFWSSWFNHIMKVDSPRLGQNYNMSYYKKYIGRITISHYSEDVDFENPSMAGYRVTLHDAWPSTLSAIEMGWEDTELGSFTVEVKYSRWTEDDTSRAFV